MPGQFKPGGGKRPKINWAHPLAGNLMFYGYDIGGLAGGTRAATAQGKIDLVSGATAYMTGASAPNLHASIYGMGVTYDTLVSDNIGSSATIQAATAAGNYTFACAFIKTGSVGANGRPFGRTANNGLSAPYVNWDFEINPASAGQGFICADVCLSSSTWATTPNGAISDNAFTSAVGTLTGGTLSLYLNGALSQTVAAATAASFNTNDIIGFGTSTSTGASNPFAGAVFYGAFWNRVLSPQEIMWLHLEPYSFLLFDLDDLPVVPYTTVVAGGSQARVMVLA